MSNPCTTPVPAPCAPTGTTPRILENFTRRFNTAKTQALIPPQPHNTNTDHNLADHCGSFSKCIKQDSPGKVNPAAFTAFTNAIASGSFADFQNVPLGGSRTLNGPLGSNAWQFVGADSSAFGDPTVPPAPSITSKLYATELIELYWCSLLRDVAFSDYATHPTAQDAATELTSLPAYQGPRHGGVVRPQSLFRGTFPGETIGPYPSQLIITPTNFGAQPISQQYITYAPGVDYMTDELTWYQVQQGISTHLVNQKDPLPRSLHNGRGFAAFTHVDELFEAYFMAYLVLGSTGVPFNPGNPYNDSDTLNGFGTFNGPDIAAVLAQVAKVALNTVWYQKWVVHLRHRPEAAAGIVHLIKDGVNFSASPDPLVFNSEALKQSHTRYGSYLLSQPFPEGSPAHPAYPTGHGTVGGACITILKFFYDGDYIFTNPLIPTSDGSSVQPYHYDPSIGDNGPLTLNGELHKLAHNITFGHGLHGGIHWRTDSDASIALGEAVAIRFLQDLACTYPEPFSITFTKLDGTPQTITNA